MATIVEHFRPLAEQMPFWLRAPGGYELLGTLVDSLPKPMRKFLQTVRLTMQRRKSKICYA